ncbi:MAG: ABC transporter substrate-binding protein, partial [Gemmatimonadetes bacterium]|nr:ABC transporter substrate-binding protein [Gemmatimonadota bacterium]
YVKISNLAINPLINALRGGGDGVLVTQVVPFPRDTSIPVVARYQAALREIDSSAQPGFVSLEGYLAGRLVVEGLRRSADPDGAPPTRESFIRTLEESDPIDLGGFVVEYGPGDNQGSDAVFLTVIRDGRFVPVMRLTR